MNVVQVDIKVGVICSNRSSWMKFNGTGYICAVYLKWLWEKIPYISLELSAELHFWRINMPSYFRI